MNDRSADVLSKSSSKSSSTQEGKERAKTIEERIAAFAKEAEQVNAEKRTLSPAELVKFIAHWTQAGPNDRKFHAEKQQTFGIAGRMVGWAGNVKPDRFAKPEHSAVRQDLKTTWD